MRTPPLACYDRPALYFTFPAPLDKRRQENLGSRREILASFIKEKSISSSENQLDLCYNKKD